MDAGGRGGHAVALGSTGEIAADEMASFPRHSSLCSAFRSLTRGSLLSAAAAEREPDLGCAISGLCTRASHGPPDLFRLAQ